MQKKKRGRPPVDNPATETLPTVRITVEQLDSYRDSAAAKDEPLSKWVRRNLDKAAKRELR